MDKTKQLAEACYDQYMELRQMAMKDPMAIKRSGDISYEMAENLWIVAAILTVGQLMVVPMTLVDIEKLKTMDLRGR